MNARLALVLSVAVTAISCVGGPPPRDAAEAKFRQTFKSMPVDTVKESEVPGIFEVWAQGKVFYYAPAQDLILFGEFYTTGGTSLTQEKIARYQESRVLTVPTDVGTTVGDGATEVVAFLDPDCGHCRQAHDWLEQRAYAGMKLRVVFLPIAADNPSYARALQFVCAPPELRREALSQVYAHESPQPGQHFLSCEQGAHALAAQADLAKSLGVDGTPTFFVKGQTVLGFDQARLETLLSTGG